MIIIPPTAPPLQPTHRPAERFAAANRNLHELQVELATGTPCSAEVDRAGAAVAESVADAVADNFARQQSLIGALRLVAGDETGLREIAAHLIAEIVGTLPQNTAEVLGDVVRFCKATRRELAALGVEELDAQTRLTAVETRLASVESRLAGTASVRAAAGIEVVA